MDQLLPILKNRIESEKQKSRNMYYDELFNNELAPIIMYGEDRGEFMQYTQTKSTEENQKIKEQALLNLSKIDIPFVVQEAQGFRIIISEHEYAAEKILDKDYMLKVAQALDSNSIVVGIPMKGLMAAVAKGKGESNLYGAICQQYDNAQTYPISKAMYYMVDGAIEMLGGQVDTKTKEDDNTLYEVSGKNDDNGRLVFTVKVGNEDEYELTNQIQRAYQQILLHVMKDAKNFSGKIDFFISPMHNKLTPTLESNVKNIAKNISEKGAVQLIGAMAGLALKVKFFHGEKLIAESIEKDPVQWNKKGNEEQVPIKKENKSKEVVNKPWWKFW